MTPPAARGLWGEGDAPRQQDKGGDGRERTSEKPPPAGQR